MFNSYYNLKNYLIFEIFLYYSLLFLFILKLFNKCIKLINCNFIYICLI